MPCTGAHIHTIRAVWRKGWWTCRIAQMWRIKALKWTILSLHGLSPLGKFSLECTCSPPNFLIEKPIKRCERGYLDVLCILIIPRNNRGGRSDLNMGRKEGRAGEEGRSERLMRLTDTYIRLIIKGKKTNDRHSS